MTGIVQELSSVSKLERSLRQRQKVPGEFGPQTTSNFALGFAVVQKLRIRVSCLDRPCGSARSLPSSSSFSHLLCPPSDDLPYLLRKIYRLKKIMLLRRKNGLMHIRED